MVWHRQVKPHNGSQMRTGLRGLQVLFMMLALAIAAHGQQKVNTWTCAPQDGPVLEHKVCNPNIDFKAARINELIVQVLEWSETPGGIEMISEESQNPHYDVNAESLILRDVLNSISVAEPRYLWQEQRGVINVRPANEYSVLDTPVAEFKVENATQGELLDALSRTGEFQNMAAAKGLSEFPFVICCGLSSFEPPRRFSIDFKNASIREILNEIVRLNDHSAWRFFTTSDWPENGKHYYRLDFAYHHF